MKNRNARLLMLLWLTPVLALAQEVTTKTFTSSGVFVVPAGVTRVDVQLWGGGGGGGGADSYKNTNRAGGGGAGGSFTAASDVVVTPGANIVVTVGVGGAGGKGGNGKTNGEAGGTSIFAAATPISAVGGAGGAFGAGKNETGQGAAATIGVTFNGGAGAEAPPGGGDGVNATGSGAGGGSGGPRGHGGNATGTTAGKAGDGGGGAGAAGVTGKTAGVWTNGMAAAEVGGGGSGGWDNFADNNNGDGTKGGDGFRGQVVVRYKAASAAQSANQLQLPAIKPVMGCEALSRASLAGVTSGVAVIDSARELPTPKGVFCVVRGQINQAATYVVALPTEHWTQRYLQSASNAGASLAVGHAGSCLPAQDGELALATNDRGGSRRDDSWTADPQKRIDWAYQYNHTTAEVAKALIKAFYGRAPRFSYFMGCSGGGRESLIVAQRYPQDFDGISAGAPSAVLSVHNGGFFHGWESFVNRRADGSIVLKTERLALLHDVVVQRCAASAGAIDGMLQVPMACRFDPAWVRCPAGTADTTKCLSDEEVGVVQKMYEGASDRSAGARSVRRFELDGYPLGSELSWPLSTPTRLGDAHKPGGDLKYLMSIEDSQAASVQALDASFRFNQEWFDKAQVLASLYNGANTNLRPLQQRGGKLILWHGAADTQVQPTSSIAYYQGVQKELGAKLTDEFMRFFLLPGVGHCGNGEGPSQIDLLSPLMAWVELHRAPDRIVAGKTAPAVRRAAPSIGPDAPEPNAAGIDAARRGAAPTPFGTADQPTLLTRPIYPFPRVARFTGRGSATEASSYEAMMAPVSTGLVPDSAALPFIGPDNQKFYRADHGKLVVAAVGPVVAVTGGRVQGQPLPAPGGAVFKGIPYAAPPVGDLRWRETMPVKAWNSVLQAGDFRPGCGPGPRGTNTAVEDCLYLNVWAPQWPASTKKLPVMFWIHGGELAGGSGTLGAGAESLARHGVILVSANYRGTLLGMMGHPELTAESPHHASGNYPLLDEIAVLKWIHANIAKFGGDPGNVTVFGFSGGAHVTSMLLATPQTHGLIHRAIIHSGSPMQSVRPYLTLAEMEKIGVVTAQLLKAPATNQLNYLRSLPATDFVELMPAVRTKLLQEYDGQAYDEGTDGFAIPTPPNEVWQSHRELRIPVMIGNAGSDSGSAPAGIGNLPTNATSADTLAWEKVLLEKFYAREPDLLQQALQLYGVTPGAKEVSSYAPYGSPAQQIGTDLNHRCSVGMSVALHSAIAPAWQFEFTRTTPGHPPTHGSDIRYVFGLDTLEDEAARKQSDLMQQYWTNFARSGDPNGPGLPQWSKYDAATKRSMEFTFDGPVLKGQPRQAVCAPYVEKYTRDPRRMSTGAQLWVRGAGGAM